MKRRTFGKKKRKDTSISLQSIYEKRDICKNNNISIKFVSIQLRLLVFEYLKTVDNQSMITYISVSH